MKTPILIATAALVSLTGSTLLYENRPNPVHATHITVADDRTDKFLVHPDLGKIYPLYLFTDHPEWEASFKLVQITDMNYTFASERVLQGENSMLSNEFQRNRSISNFQQDIKQVMGLEEKEPAGRAHSAVYRTLAGELNTLHKMEGSRILLAYTDLMEYSDTINFYNPDTLMAIKKNPEPMQTLLEKEVPLADLTGIDIYLIYQPETYENNVSFTIVANFYKRLFELKGATVHIQANL